MTDDEFDDDTDDEYDDEEPAATDEEERWGEKDNLLWKNIFFVIKSALEGYLWMVVVSLQDPPITDNDPIVPAETESNSCIRQR